MASDEELLRAWRGGDAVAGSALVERHFDAIYRFFRSKVGDDIEDLVQSTFLACVESRTEPTAGFRPFLYAVARNKLVDHLRFRYRRGEEVDWDAISVADLGTTPSGAVYRDQREALLTTALRRLPVDWQIALELAYWEDMPGPDIARVLGIAEGTVRSRLGRARARLREELAALSTAEDADRSLELFAEKA